MPIRHTQGKQKVIAIVGPTASGKSSLGIYLAQKLGGEVISADSRQVYRGLDIGTGKVTKKEMQGVTHHLLDVARPARQFSADDFVRRAGKAMQRIKLPIVVGGTGLYVDLLLGRMSYPHVPPNPALRERLERHNTDKLFAMLRRKDPRRAATIEPGHKRRLIRALEIAEAIGASPLQNPRPAYDALWLGLNPTNLPARIRARLRARVAAGMVAEAKRLHNPPAGGGLSYARMDALGLEYRYLARLLQGKITKQQFEVELERAINQYAKRQRRWFKRNDEIHWVGSKSEALRLAKAHLSR